jgi:hypothetical protein
LVSVAILVPLGSSGKFPLQKNASLVPALTR